MMPHTTSLGITNGAGQRTRQEYLQDRGFFDSSREDEEEEDEDEDYSLNEDMIKNQKKYKNDEALNARQKKVPKIEIEQLIADQDKDLPSVGGLN